ncbi:hypothetical protein [Bradyrhizobium sp. LB13.1]
MSRGRSSYYSRENRGREIARQHVAEAEQLSRELGGTDEDVKSYFFSLPARELQIILDLYEHHYGAQARNYANTTIANWRTGKRRMSGQTATRLFRLLPPVMPLQKKYQLISNLWDHCGPTSKKILRVGLDANVDEILSHVRQHIESVIVHYRIPDNLEKRFEWLSAGDSLIKQDLLGHLRQREKSLVIEGARLQLPVMLTHLRTEQGLNTHRLAQVLKVGRHELEVTLERDFTGVALMDPPTKTMPSSRSSQINGTNTGGYNWVWWIIGIALLLFFMTRK